MCTEEKMAGFVLIQKGNILVQLVRFIVENTKTLTQVAQLIVLVFLRLQYN